MQKTEEFLVVSQWQTADTGKPHKVLTNILLLSLSLTCVVSGVLLCKPYHHNPEVRKQSLKLHPLYMCLLLTTHPVSLCQLEGTPPKTKPQNNTTELIDHKQNTSFFKGIFFL